MEIITDGDNAGRQGASIRPSDNYYLTEERFKKSNRPADYRDTVYLDQRLVYSAKP